MYSNLLENNVFQLFLKEIEPLGFRVSPSPPPGAQPYAVVGGRSNARWWLIPLANRYVATSGLAMFQPIISSSKMLKCAAIALNAVGLSQLWARNRVYISCNSELSDLFRIGGLHYAFFTGTNSPHRKTAIQIMDSKGGIKGFAKISIMPIVKRLILDEQDNLEYVQSLHLSSVEIPRVLLSKETSGVQVLVTNTKKNRFSKTLTSFTVQHQAFLAELTAKTGSGEELRSSKFLHDLGQQTQFFSDKLTESWATRLAVAHREISSLAPIVTSGMVYCHGDFTPWNTFMVAGKLYVFDWEYAKQSSPPGYDLVHFILSLPSVKRQTIKKTIGQMRKLLRKMKLAEGDAAADILFLCYLCGHSLRHIARESEENNKIFTWDGEQEAAAFMDSLIERKN